MKATEFATISGISSILCFTAGICWHHLTIDQPKQQLFELSRASCEDYSSKQFSSTPSSARNIRNHGSKPSPEFYRAFIENGLP
jgi:hypothetical protein